MWPIAEKSCDLAPEVPARQGPNLFHQRSIMDLLDSQPSKLTDLALQMLCAGVEWLREERPDLVIAVLTHLLKQEVERG